MRYTCCVIDLIPPPINCTDILEMKDCTAFILKVAGVFMNSSFLKIKAICTFETLETKNPVTPCKKPEDQNPQHQCLGNLKALM